MGANMQGIQPSSLTPEELVRYAYLKNDNGLPKDWCNALIQNLELLLEVRQAFLDTLDATVPNTDK